MRAIRGDYVVVPPHIRYYYVVVVPHNNRGLMPAKSNKLRLKRSILIGPFLRKGPDTLNPNGCAIIHY